MKPQHMLAILNHREKAVVLLFAAPQAAVQSPENAGVLGEKRVR
jgi:hypothetical protein